MSALRLISNRTSQQALSNSDYTWDYEYYEYGPVSFEGLKAHKCKFSGDHFLQLSFLCSCSSLVTEYCTKPFLF